MMTKIARTKMATIMTPEEFTRKHDGDLDALEQAIEEASNDAIMKESMNRESLTSRNITSGTEQLMWATLK